MAALRVVAISYAPAQMPTGRSTWPDVLMAVLVAVSYATTRMPKGRSTSQTRHATLDGYAQASHQRCAWQTLRRCRLQHICEHSGQVFVPVESAYPPQLARNSSSVDQHHWSRSREENLAFYRRDVVSHRTAVQRPTSRSSKLVSRRATSSRTRQL